MKQFCLFELSGKEKRIKTLRSDQNSMDSWLFVQQFQNENKKTSSTAKNQQAERDKYLICSVIFLISFSRISQSLSTSSSAKSSLLKQESKWGMNSPKKSNSSLMINRFHVYTLTFEHSWSILRQRRRE